MKLEQLCEEETMCCAGEVLEEETSDKSDSDDDGELEDDLCESNNLLEQCLLMFEELTICKKKIIKVPKGMMDLMEEVAEHLDQFIGYEDTLKG